MGTTSHIWCKVESTASMKQKILVIQEDKGHFKKGDKVEFHIDKKHIFMFEKMDSK